MHANNLIKKIKRRLLLNHNVQIYQLASLFTLDGIVRYRKKMGEKYPEFNVVEDKSQYWHSDWFFVETWRIKKFENIDLYIENELDDYLNILQNFEQSLEVKAKRLKRIIKPSSETNKKRQLSLFEMLKNDPKNGMTEWKKMEKQRNSDSMNSSSSYHSDYSSHEETSDVVELEIEPEKNKESNENNSDNIENIISDQETNRNQNIAQDDILPKNNLAGNDYSKNDNSPMNDNVIPLSSDEDKYLDELRNKERLKDNSEELLYMFQEEVSIDSINQDELLFFDEIHIDLSQFEEEEEEEEDEEEEKTEKNKNELNLESNKKHNNDAHKKKSKLKNISEKKQDENYYDDINDKGPAKKKANKESSKKKKGSLFYENQKSALKSKNIIGLILTNASYLGLSSSESMEAASELLTLLRTPFKEINDYCQLAINPKSNFIQFWHLMKDFQCSDHCDFQALSKLAMRLFSIPPSEAGAERKLSKLKWRFPDRRNRISEETLMNEIYIEETFMQKLNSNKEFSKAIWELPPHNNS